MSKKTGSGRRFMIAKNLIMMLATLAAILVAIFAWFRANPEATATGISVKSQSPELVELAVPEKVNGKDYFPIHNSSWTDTLHFKDSGFLKDLVKDVTSGGKQFVVPNFEAAKNLEEGRKVIADDTWIDGLSSKDALINGLPNDDDQYHYVSLDFYIRSKSKTLSVTSDSYLAAGSELGIDGDMQQGEVKPLVGTDIYRRSSYGPGATSANSQYSFSSDAIIGAMRVSLVGAPVDSVNRSTQTVTENETTKQVDVATEALYKSQANWADAAELKFLWLPRPDIYLQAANNQDNWRLYTGISPTDSNASKTYVHTFYEGKTVKNTDVKKGLELHKYYDSNVQYFTDCDETIPSYFHVTDVTKKTSEENYPKFGQSASIAGDGSDVSQSIAFIPESEDNRDTTGYYVYKYTLNLWIEGEDAEARRSMNKGVFNLELSFGN